ncbi:MAG: hypothetical protein D6711_04200, partial [Chloroflexi bacterium]
SFSPALTNGVYRLHICGTTSIVSASNPTIALNGGEDAIINFTIDVSAGQQTTPGSQVSQPELLGITELPSTGETPAWRDDVLQVMMLAGGLILLGGAVWVIKQRYHA